MNTLVCFGCALAVSLLGILYLVQIDEKRRRVYRVRAKLALPQSRSVGWLIVFVPAIVLLCLGQLSAFLGWAGAITVLSWMIVGRVPTQAGGEVVETTKSL